MRSGYPSSVAKSPAVSLPEQLQEIVDDFAAVGEKDRLMLLLDHADALPELPARYAEHPDLLERVLECQSPVFLFVEVDVGAVAEHHRPPPLPAPMGDIAPGI